MSDGENRKKENDGDIKKHKRINALEISKLNLNVA